MQKQNPRNRPNPDRTDRDEAPDNAANRGMRQDRRIEDPPVREERKAPGAANAENELDDEDYEGEGEQENA